MDIRDNKAVYYVGKSILVLLKYFCLALFIFTAGITLGLTIFSLFKGDSMPNTLIANMASNVTGNTVQDVLESILKYGKVDTIVAACGIGFANAITYLLLYFVLAGYVKLFKSLMIGNIYTKDSFELLKESVPLSLILLLTQPIVLVIIRDLIKINDVFGTYNFIGIPFVIISTLLYMVVDKGLTLESKIKVYERKLAKVEEEKQEAEIMALEKRVREHHDAKAKKKVIVKKVVEKKEEVKPVVKKSTTKKVVKEEPKKIVKKSTETKKTVAKTTKKKTSK